MFAAGRRSGAACCSFLFPIVYQNSNYKINIKNYTNQNYGYQPRTPCEVLKMRSRQVGGLGERADLAEIKNITTLVEIAKDHASIIEGT